MTYEKGVDIDTWAVRICSTVLLSILLVRHQFVEELVLLRVASCSVCNEVHGVLHPCFVVVEFLNLLGEIELRASVLQLLDELHGATVRHVVLDLHVFQRHRLGVEQLAKEVQSIVNVQLKDLIEGSERHPPSVIPVD
jgi:hypothetical protein